MSPISWAGFGAIAMSLTLGAVQFASGHDLTGGLGAGLGTSFGTGLGTSLGTSVATTGLATAPASPETVNRAAKADRAEPDRGSSAASARTRTISIRLDGLADTSVLIRIPAVRESGNLTPPPLLPARPAERKLTVACEPVVSTLTEVAKLLQPGRCVT
jgi:hypothetical protein